MYSSAAAALTAQLERMTLLTIKVHFNDHTSPGHIFRFSLICNNQRPSTCQHFVSLCTNVLLVQLPNICSSIRRPEKCSYKILSKHWFISQDKSTLVPAVFVFSPYGCLRMSIAVHSEQTVLPNVFGVFFILGYLTSSSCLHHFF